MTPVLLDTGVIVALLDRHERFHQSCLGAVDGLYRPLVTCEAVIAESCYLLRRIPGAAEAVLQNVEAGVFQIPFHLPPHAAAVRRILRKYADRGIDLADACLVSLADLAGTGDVLTLDHEFQVYRWRGKLPFHLLAPLA